MSFDDGAELPWEEWRAALPHGFPESPVGDSLWLGAKSFGSSGKCRSFLSQLPVLNGLALSWSFLYLTLGQARQKTSKV